MLADFETDSPYNAIDSVRWSGDGRKIYFIGRRAGENWKGQVYSIPLGTGKLSQLTHEAHNIVEFAISQSGKKLVYAAMVPPDWTHRNRYGFVVEGETFEDVLSTNPNTVTPTPRYYSMDLPGGAVRAIPLMEPNRNTPPQISISPDGKWAVVPHYLREYPAPWSEYAILKLMYEQGDPLIRVNKKDSELKSTLVDQDQFGKYLNFAFQYQLIDLVKGITRPLIDAPTPGGPSQVTWLLDRPSVELSRTYAPFELCRIEDRSKCAERNDANIEVDLNSGRARLIGFGQQRAATGASARMELSVIQSTDSPPEISAADKVSGRSRVLTDLNPQFRKLTLAPAKVIDWQDELLGGMSAQLLYPTDYEVGHRYPLVIQDYGFSAKRFLVTGPGQTAFSARALSARGIMVLNIGCWHHAEDFTGQYSIDGDAPRSTRCFESAVDELDKRGLINRSKVGIIGFSASGVHVMNTITFSKYHFLAATIADSVAATPWAYSWMFGQFRPGMMQFEREWMNSQPLIGDIPWGSGLNAWLERSPVYHLDRIRTPLRYELISYPPDIVAAPGYWDVYASLKRMHRPVEMIRLPNDQHNLETPFKRFMSEQGNVDWFAFWLKDEMRAAPIAGTPETVASLREQYSRWMKLKNQYDILMKASPPPPATFSIPYARNPTVSIDPLDQ